VHIKASPGFNIGAAGQPPGCTNSLHFHNTAEVFFVLKGRWRFFWGRDGKSGEVVLEEGDIFNIPTQVFRGFENVGTDYGVIMSMLGGDDAGGGVIWAPEVLHAAQVHGLQLSSTGRLYDTKRGEQLPANETPMRPLSEAELALLPDFKVNQVVPKYIGRYLDMRALAKGQPCDVISETGLIKDRPGFTVDMLSEASLEASNCTVPKDLVYMVMHGHWRISWGEEVLNLSPGDTCWVPPGLEHQIEVAMSGEAAIFRVTRTNDAAGLTWSDAK